MTEGLPEIPGLRHVERIGRGRFSTVHRYHDSRVDRDYAVRVLGDVAPQVRERFVAEAKAVAELGNHPNILPVHQVGETHDGHLYVAMQYCAAPSSGAPQSVERVLEIGVQVACALQTAHEHHVAHRNIKPANILVDENEVPLLTDFGTAARSHCLPWSAPEIIEASGRGGVSAEVFALGGTLWHLLTGHSPFVVPHGDNSRSVIESRILHGSPRPTGRAPRSLEEVLRRAMAPNPLARYRSAGELATELQNVQRELSAIPTPLVLDAAPVTVLERPAAVETTGRHQRVPDPLFVAQMPSGPSAPRKPRWPMYAAASALGAAAITVGVILLTPNAGDEGPGPKINSGNQPQNAGADKQLPGKPVITATRLGAGTLRFTWTYTEQQSGDTFTWRTTDGLKNGTATAPELDLASTGVLCVEVKVVRADGTTSPDWSEQGCGS
jgi:eukaryotic-like serine/threonine-protein kinase